jgi:aromatic ring-cleaving dioxygenase
VRRDRREVPGRDRQLPRQPVGPHPIANALLIFKPDQFEQVVPYLMLNRAGLNVLVHPLTEDAVEDHSSYAIWLGNPVDLKLHTLPRGRGGWLERTRL